MSENPLGDTQQGFWDDFQRYLDSIEKISNRRRTKEKSASPKRTLVARSIAECEQIYLSEDQREIPPVCDADLATAKWCSQLYSLVEGER